MPPHKLIIDADPGIDDALAISYAALHPDIELLGLTTVYGNCAVEQATKNAQYVLNLFDRNQVPVVQGAGHPLKTDKNDYPAAVHGQNGLGDIPIVYQTDFLPQEESAAEFIVRMINENPNEITLVLVGPLTNVALALILDPSIAIKTKQVIFAVGSAFVDDGMVSTGEANIWDDPDAACRVLSAEWEVVVLGLDTTWEICFCNAKMARIAENASEAGAFLGQISQIYHRFCLKFTGCDGIALHDPSAVIYATNPELFTVGQEKTVDVIGKVLGYDDSDLKAMDDMLRQKNAENNSRVDVCQEARSEQISDVFESILSLSGGASAVN